MCVVVSCCARPEKKPPPRNNCSRNLDDKTDRTNHRRIEQSRFRPLVKERTGSSAIRKRPGLWQTPSVGRPSPVAVPRQSPPQLPGETTYSRTGIQDRIVHRQVPTIRECVKTVLTTNQYSTTHLRFTTKKKVELSTFTIATLF